jgi:putative transposase
MHVHLVFVTKYRSHVFTQEILNDLENIFSNSKLVNSLKGVSSRLIRKKKYPTIQRALWRGNLWSPSYFASSCGGAPLAVIRQYIEQQGHSV